MGWRGGEAPRRTAALAPTDDPLDSVVGTWRLKGCIGRDIRCAQQGHKCRGGVLVGTLLTNVGQPDQLARNAWSAGRRRRSRQGNRPAPIAPTYPLHRQPGGAV